MLDQILVDTKKQSKNMGHFVSKKTREKISQGNKKRWQDSKYRQMMSDKHKGKTIPKKIREKISESHKKRVFDKKRKNQLDEARKKRKFDLDTKVLMSEAAKKRWDNKEYRKIISKKTGMWSKKMWKDPKYRSKMNLFKKGNRAFLNKNISIGPNKPESIVQDMVPKYVQYTGNGDFWVKLKHRFKNPDFIVRPFSITKKVIEVYGDYWHRDDKNENIVLEYKNRGISCLVLWEHNIKKNQEIVKSKLNNFLEERRFI